jgi:hypothetical protein
VQDVTILPPLPPPVEPPPPLQTVPVAPLYAPPPISTPTATPTATQAPTPVTTEAPTSPLAPHGLSFGLRLAVGFPVGEVFGQPPSSTMTTTENNLSDEFALIFPVTVDVGYRLTPHWYVGGYFGFGIGTPPASTCPADAVQCDQNDIRFGLEAKYLNAPSAFIDPWIGAGLGWEIANQSNDAGGGHSDGPEFFHLRAGLDFDLGRHFFGGPEAMFTFASFTANDAPKGTPITLHDWFTLGVSIHYDL